MKTMKTTVYKFNELSDDAKESAIENLSCINVDYDWWECIYEDAENVGLKITGFDIDRASFCQGDLLDDACFMANKILADHGESCETFKTSKQFLADRDDIVNSAEKNEDGEFVDEYELDEKLDEIESEYLKSILEDYRIMLQHEFEYETSEKAIIETIECNEYDFLDIGKLF